MYAMQCPAFGSPLHMVDLPAPALQARQVRIQVAAAGVNFADTLFMNGKYQEKVEPPLIPGMELAGTVLEVAPDVTTCRPGDRVMALVTGGAFAEQVVAAESDVLILPDGLDFSVAAGFPVAYGTSHLGLKFKAGLRAGETLVVHGAAGGVGLTAVEIGAAMGAKVIATAGGEEKVNIPLAHGASHGIDYKTQDIRDEVKALTHGRGADVYYDPVGGTVFDVSLRAIAPNGRILVVGFASGHVPQIPANILLVKNVTVIGYWWGAYRKLSPGLVRESLQECLNWWDEGRLKPHISNVLPLSHANEAVAMLKSRSSTGKVVLSVE